MKRLIAAFDGFTLALLAVVALASILPVPAAYDGGLGIVVDTAVVLLFFLHGAKLPREAVIAGWLNWRLQLAVVAATFGLFPLLGLLIAPAVRGLGLDAALAAGLLYLCCLPSTVQSSIGFTSIARGNVAAAVCAATLSNLAGILLTPLLTGLLLSARAGAAWSSIGTIAWQLLLPFALGQIARPLVGEWIARRKAVIGLVDRGAILLMVYAAFGAAVREGLWGRLSLLELAGLVASCCLLLAIVLLATRFAARLLGFPRADETVMVFCGSKKSLVTGVPMANILFSPAAAGVAVLPLMIFHQIQLMVCAVIARNYARAAEEGAR